MYKFILLKLVLLISILGHAFADEHPCVNAGGVLIKGQCFCKDGDAKPIIPEKEQCLPKIIDTLKNFNSNQSLLTASCSCSVNSLHASSMKISTLSCPTYLINKFEEDKKGFVSKMITGGTPNDLCRFHNNDNEFKTAKELEEYLTSQELTNSRREMNTLSNPICLNHPSHKLTEEDKKIIISDYYYSTNRLKGALLGALESVASMNSLMFEPLMKDDSGVINEVCKTTNLSVAKDWCAKLQSCSPEGGLDTLVEETEQALAVISELDKQIAEQEKSIKTLPPDNRSLGGNKLKIDKINKKKQEIEEKRSLVISMFPWVEGKEFKRIYDSKKGNTERAIKEQFKTNKSLLVSKINQYNQAIDCLVNNSKHKTCETLYEILDQVPAHIALAMNETNTAAENKKSLMTNLYFQNAECRQLQRKTKGDVNETFNDFVIGSAVTIATAGIGTIAAGAKATTTIVNGSKMIRIGAKAADVGQSLLTKAGIAKAALFGVNATYISLAVKNTVHTCSESLNQLDTSRINPVDVQNGPSCPKENSKVDVNVLSNVRSCVLASVLTAGATALPLLPPRLSAFLKKRQSNVEKSIQQAESTAAATSSEAGIIRRGLDNLKLVRGAATKKLSDKAYSVFDKIYMNPKYIPTLEEMALLKAEGVDNLFKKYQEAGALVQEWNQKLGVLYRSKPHPHRKGWQKLKDAWKILIPPGLPNITRNKAESLFKKIIADYQYQLSDDEMQFAKKWNLLDQIENYRGDLKIHAGEYISLSKARDVGGVLKWTIAGSAAAIGLAGNKYIAAKDSFAEDNKDGMSRYDEKVELIYFAPMPHASIRVGGLVYNYGVFDVSRHTLDEFRQMVGFGETFSGSHTRIELKLTDDEKRKLREYLEEDVGKVYPLVFPYNDCVSQCNKAVKNSVGIDVPVVADRSQVASIAYYKLQKFLGSDKIGDIRFAAKNDEVVKEKVKDTAVNILDAAFFMRYAGTMFFVTPIVDSDRSTFEVEYDKPTTLPKDSDSK